MKKYKVTWKEFDSLVNALAHMIDFSDIKNIYGIPRGGLVPAVMLSHLSGKPLIVNVGQVSSKTLIVDDLTDTGATLRMFARQVEDIKTATLFHNRRSKFKPTYFSKLKPLGWICYPYEQ